MRASGIRFVAKPGSAGNGDQVTTAQPRAQGTPPAQQSIEPAAEETSAPLRVTQEYVGRQVIDDGSAAVNWWEGVTLPEGVPGEVVRDGVDIRDALSIVAYLRHNEINFHPLLERAQLKKLPAEIVKFSGMLMDNLNSESGRALIKVLGWDAIRHSSGLVSGVVNDLVMHSIQDEPVHEQFALSALALTLAKNGIRVMTDEGWNMFLLQPRDGKPFPWLRLQCTPYDESVDRHEFFGLSSALQTRRFSTISATDGASFDLRGQNMLYTLNSPGGEGGGPVNYFLKSITSQGENPHVLKHNIWTRLRDSFSRNGK